MSHPTSERVANGHSAGENVATARPSTMATNSRGRVFTIRTDRRIRPRDFSGTVMFAPMWRAFALYFNAHSPQRKILKRVSLTSANSIAGLDPAIQPLPTLPRLRRGG